MIDHHNRVIVERKFVEDDRKALENLAWEAFGKKLGWIFSRRENEGRVLLRYSLQPQATLIARDESTREILGYCSYKTSRTPENKIVEEIVNRHNNWREFLLLFLEHSVTDRELYIQNLVVRPDTRGKGVGSLLLRESFSIARELDCDRVSLHVILENDKAKRLYNREGFRDKSTTRFCCCLPYFFGNALTGFHYLVKTV